ncbi:phage protein [Natroniella sp. ANB-PHB2]|uniref:phage protein n=1 Tax=Natroniella sp. ANB-PHB2 TaxID=3384444 RepID=UPI0038D376D7
MTELFNRKVELQIRDKIIRYPDLHIEFETEFDVDSDANNGFIRVYNLSKSTINDIKKGLPFKLKAGYKNNFGTIMVGSIASSNTEWNVPDKITELIVSDNSEDWLSKTVNKTWRKNTRASTIMKDIADLLPIAIGEIAPVNDNRYPKGKTFSTKIKVALEELAADTNSKFHISRGRLFIREPLKGKQEVVNLNKDTGLIATPQRIEDGDEERWLVQSLLNYRIESDSVINVESKSINGLYLVKGGSHYLAGNDFYTEMEVVVI